MMRPPWRWPLYTQVACALSAGLLAGWISGTRKPPAASFRADLELYALGGELFMSALKLVVVPLVVSSIASAAATMGRTAGFARLGFRTLGYFFLTTLCATLIGLLLVNTCAPGQGGLAKGARAVLAETGGAAAQGARKIQRAAELQAGNGGGSIFANLAAILRDLVPPNIFSAMAKDNMLGIILASLVFGIFVGRLEPGWRDPLENLLEGLNKVLLSITWLVLRCLPLGVFCLIARTAAETVAAGDALERLGQVWRFALVVTSGLALQLFAVYPLLLVLCARVRPWRHFKAFAPAMLTAFTTASSSATLPVSLDCLEKRAGVSKRVAGFVAPLGATVNMDGTALYECAVVMFLAQLHGVHLDAASQFLIVTLALLTSIGVAGIPAASLGAIVLILGAVNARLPAGAAIPPEALGLVLIVDRPLDMLRTTVNVTGDSVGAVILARGEGEDPLARDPDSIEVAL